MRLPLSFAALLVACAGPAAASPATDFLAAVRQNIDARYYAKPGVDVRAIFDAAEARLVQACAAQQDACPQEMGVAEAREAVKALGDAHTRLEQVASSAGPSPAPGGPAAQTAPLGWLIKKERNGEAFYVAWVAPGGPAEKAGVRRHDLIAAPPGMTAPALTAAAEPGRFTLSRGGRSFEVALAPQSGSVRPMPRLDGVGDVAVLHVPAGVGEGMAQAAHDLIAKAKADGKRALILDLRDNGGGGIQCAAMASAFINYSAVQSDPQGGRRVLTVTPGRARVVADDDVEELVVERASRWDGPMAILVNDNTGSCAEAVAIQAALAGRARIIGEPSIGIGNNVVMGFPVSAGWRLVMTIAYSTTPEGKPLPPRPPLDVTMTDDPVVIATTGRDSVLEAALRDLSAG